MVLLRASPVQGKNGLGQKSRSANSGGMRASGVQGGFLIKAALGECQLLGWEVFCLLVILAALRPGGVVGTLDHTHLLSQNGPLR